MYFDRVADHDFKTKQRETKRVNWRQKRYVIRKLENAQKLTEFVKLKTKGKYEQKENVQYRR